jgi:hypothetical protein
MFAAHGGKRLIAQQSHGMYAESGKPEEEYCRVVKVALTTLIPTGRE